MSRVQYVIFISGISVVSDVVNVFFIFDAELQCLNNLVQCLIIPLAS
jgi:hypothetical protein